MHSEDWAKLGTGFVDWFKAHPSVSLFLAGFAAGAIMTGILCL